MYRRFLVSMLFGVLYHRTVTVLTKNSTHELICCQKKSIFAKRFKD